MTDKIREFWEGAEFDGVVSSTPQGKLLGVQTAIPDATSDYAGCYVIYDGATTASYTKGYIYKCSGTAWEKATLQDIADLTTITNGLQAEIDTNAGDISALEADLQTETSNRESADATLQGNIDKKQDIIALTASRAVVTGTDGKLASSGITATEVGYLSGVGSNIQTQIDGLSTRIDALKSFNVQVVDTLPTTGEASTIYFVKSSTSTTGNLYDEYIYVNGAWELIGSTAFSLDITQDASGISINGTALQTANASRAGLMTSAHVGSISTLETEMDTAQSDIATLQSDKQDAITGGATTIVSDNLVVARALVSSNAGKVAVSDVTATELGYLDGVTSNIQTQLTNIKSDVAELQEEISTVTNGTISVTVTSATGNIEGRTITLVPSDTTLESKTYTLSSTGTVSASVKAGTWTVKCDTPSGYFSVADQSVTVEAQKSASVSMVLYRKPILNVTVTDEDAETASLTVTATVGSSVKTGTVSMTSSGTGTVQIIMDAVGSCTVETTYPSSASGASSWTGTIANDGTYAVALSITRTVIWTVDVAIATSDPSARCTYPQTVTYNSKSYSNKSYGKTCASGTGASCMNDWAGDDLISGIKRQTGNSSSGWTDVTDTKSAVAGSSGGTDVMTYFPTYYLSITNDGTKVRISFANQQVDSTFQDYAGSVGSTRYGHFRLGNFLATNVSSKAYSYGGSAPTGSVSLTNWITYAKARATGYDIMTWYQWTYLGALAVMLYKSTDLQSAMAQGYVGGSSVQSNTALTFTNDYGMAGSTSTTQRMAFFWIHDYWGNMYQWVGGMSTNSSSHICTQFGYSTASNSDMTDSGVTGVGGGSYISKVTGTTATGFAPAETSGSSTTYWADGGYVNASNFPYVGGGYSNGSLAGPFYCRVAYSASDTHSYIGSRLSYRL